MNENCLNHLATFQSISKLVYKSIQANNRLLVVGFFFKGYNQVFSAVSPCGLPCPCQPWGVEALGEVTWARLLDSGWALV